MNNHVIGMTMKIRTLEDLIDCAQRCQLKPNSEMEKELEMMSLFRDRIWKDVHNFLDKREIDMSERMRVLTLRKRDAKTSLVKDQKVYKQILDRLAKTEKITDYLKKIGDRAEEDLEISIEIARQMVNLVSMDRGSDLWVMLARRKAHRAMLKAKGIEI